jgi:serine/threonine-protein kinase
MLGTILDRRYRIIQTLSEGGFGQTYIAEDTRRPGHPKCVVKQLKPASSDTLFLQNARRLFWAEAEALERLGNHDQIPRLLAYFEEDEEFYLIQDFIDGHPLTHELVPKQRWSDEQIYPLLSDVLNVLAFVHSQGVIHRDIKPDNLIRRHHDSRVVLVDFGSVKQIRAEFPLIHPALTHHIIGPTISVGTPGYMATEQSRGKPRFNSDIYGLGVICIQAATGLSPTQFDDDPQTGEFLWVSKAAVSEKLATVLSKMVCYHFRDRYQSAVEVLNALGLPYQGDQPSVLPAPISTIPCPSPATVVSLYPPASELDAQAPQPTVVSFDTSAPSTNGQPPSEQPATSSSELDAAQNSSTSAQSFAQFLPTTVSPPLSDDIEDTAQPILLETSLSATIISETSASEAELEPLERPSSDQQTLPKTDAVIDDGLNLSAESGSITFDSAATNPASANPKEAASVEPMLLTSKRAKYRNYLLAGSGVALALLAVGGGGTYLRQQYHYNLMQASINEVESLRNSGQYDQCAAQAQTITDRHINLYYTAQRLSGDCLLAAAEQLAETSFREGIVKASTITASMDTYPKAQERIRQWSDEILQIATNKYDAGNLDEAVAIATAIPETSPRFDQVQTIIAQWQDTWATNETLLSKAQDALERGDWQGAIAQAQQIEETPYWQPQASAIINKANTAIRQAQAQQRAASSSSSSLSSGSAASGDRPSRTSQPRSPGGWSEDKI